MVQAALLFVSELWSMLEEMMMTVEVTHIILIRKITGKRARITIDRRRVTLAAGEVLR